jgi:hypothetical protein
LLLGLARTARTPTMSAASSRAATFGEPRRL